MATFSSNAFSYSVIIFLRQSKLQIYYMHPPWHAYYFTLVIPVRHAICSGQLCCYFEQLALTLL